MKLLIPVFLFLTIPIFCIAETGDLCSKSTTGTDFWFGFMENRFYREEYRTLHVIITSEENTDVKITIGSPLSPVFSVNYNVLAGIPYTVELPWNLTEATGSESKQPRGVHLTSGKPVSVFAVNWDPNSTDITVVYPVGSLGTEYFAMCYYPNIDPSNPLSGAGRNSEFLIVATEDQTRVEITPSKVTHRLVPKDSTFTVVLNRGEVFQVQSENDEGSGKNGQGDLTGSHVVTDKPVAFFSGSLSTTIPNDKCCYDHLFEQIPSLQSWGSEFYAVPFQSRASDIVRILAAYDNTAVKIQNDSLVYLDSGEFYEFELNQPYPKQIISGKPVLVAQFSQSNQVDSIFTNGNGDPFMIILQSPNQSINRALFSTYKATKEVEDSVYITIQKNYVSLVTQTSEITKMYLDGENIGSSFQPINNGDYSFARIEITEGAHSVYSDGETGFNAYVYGFGGFESYGFSVGADAEYVLELGADIGLFKGDTLVFCYGDTVTLDAGPDFESYLWNNSSTSQKVDAADEGLFWVEAKAGGCVLRDSVYVLKSNPKVNIGEGYTTIGCSPYQVPLSGEAGYKQYIWQNEADEIISVKQNINADSTGEYRLTVIDRYMCAARDTFSLLVLPVPEMKIIGDSIICSEKNTKLEVLITGEPDSIWNFPGNFDWFTNNAELILKEKERFSVQVETPSDGDFEIFYKLTTIDRCEVTDTFKIRFHPQPENSFTIEEDNTCLGYSKILRFTGKATGSAEYLWDLGGRVVLDTINATGQVYLISAGTVQPEPAPVKLIIVDKGCRSEEITQSVTGAQPNFSMVADKTRGCDSLNVMFTGATTTYLPVQFYWTIDDSLFYNQPVFEHSFDQPGFYNVKLSVSDHQTGCVNSFNIDSMIRVYPTPVAHITADEEKCYAGEALLVYTNHIDSSFCIWEIGGNIISGFNYDSVVAAIYQPFEQVKLTVSEFGCLSETFEMMLKRKPVFDFSVDKDEGCQPLLVTATAITRDPQLDFLWITDSLPLAGTSNLYFFPDTGSFDIGLIAFSTQTGCIDTLIKPNVVWVHEKPLAKFEVDYPVALLDNAEITFINYSENAVNWFWDFGDENNSTEFNPRHRFGTTGEFTAVQIVLSDFGCADTSAMVIKILPEKSYVVNAFRPGSDLAENQVFMPAGSGMTNEGFALKIFNRWGEMVFESDSPLKPWDGKIRNGADAPMGNYLWVTTYTDIQGVRRSEKGQVLLIR